MRNTRNLLLVCLLCAGKTGAAMDLLGRVDTIGGTTYDWQYGWSVSRRLASSGEGLHAIWIHSTDTGGTYPDRNGRYNHLDFSTGAWNWIDPDFVASGVGVFAERSGIGNLDVDRNGAVVVSGYSATGPVVAAGTGGIFEYCQGPNDYVWPLLAAGYEGNIHVGLVDAASCDCIWYSRIQTWCRWQEPMPMHVATLPAFNIAASKVASWVCLAWLEPESLVNSVMFMYSTDGGTGWSRIRTLPPPPAFGGDTLTSFSYGSPFPFYDSQNRLHLIAAVFPVVNNSALVQPAGVWHWCQENEPDWSEVHRAGCDPAHMLGGLGYNVAYADRPSLGEGEDGLYVAWEQFDSSNVEPQTGLLRAGIWLSGSQDNGASWTPGVRITDRNAVSHRYPCIADRMVSGGPAGDTVVVLYLDDLVAGSVLYNQGPHTFNPVICQFVRSDLVGLSQEMSAPAMVRRAVASIVRGSLLLPTSLQSAHYSLLSTDGRLVADLVPGAHDVRRLSPGVYFVREGGMKGMREPVTKVVVTR